MGSEVDRSVNGGGFRVAEVPWQVWAFGNTVVVGLIYFLAVADDPSPALIGASIAGALLWVAVLLRRNRLGWMFMLGTVAYGLLAGLFGSADGWGGRVVPLVLSATQLYLLASRDVQEWVAEKQPGALTQS